MSVASQTSPVVTCTNLTKRYEGGSIALDDLNLTIEKGMSFGLLGENGAGKSTLVRLIMGFLSPTRGELFVLGEHDVNLAHQHIGYLHEQAYIELRFTATKYLRYMAQLSGLWGHQARCRVSEVLELVDLSAASEEKLANYSKGMLQRLCIAQTLLTDPDFFIFDEPTSGLDPYSQWKVRQIINELRNRGKTLLICSHYLAEVESLCETVGILQRGHLLLNGAVKDMIQLPDAVEILLREDQKAATISELLNLGAYVLEQERNLLKIGSPDQQHVLALLVQAKIPILSLNPVSRTLEEFYIQLTRPNETRDGVLAHTSLSSASHKAPERSN